MVCSCRANLLISKVTGSLGTSGRIKLTWKHACSKRKASYWCAYICISRPAYLCVYSRLLWSELMWGHRLRSCWFSSLYRFTLVIVLFAAQLGLSALSAGLNSNIFPWNWKTPDIIFKEARFHFPNPTHLSSKILQTFKLNPTVPSRFNKQFDNILVAIISISDFIVLFNLSSISLYFNGTLQPKLCKKKKTNEQKKNSQVILYMEQQSSSIKETIIHAISSKSNEVTWGLLLESVHGCVCVLTPSIHPHKHIIYPPVPPFPNIPTSLGAFCQSRVSAPGRWRSVSSPLLHISGCSFTECSEAFRVYL